MSRNDASLRSRMVVTTDKTNGGGGFCFSIFVFVVLCIVIVHVFDSSHPLPIFGSKSFVNSDLFEVHNQIFVLPPARPYRGVGKIGRQTWRVLQNHFRHCCASRFSLGLEQVLERM